jgi:hypothetical protein
MPSTSTGQTRSIKIDVVLQGIRPIMFDRYAGDNKTQLDPIEKIYKDGKTKTKVLLPAENIFSFLTAVNTTSAPKRLLDSREYRNVCAGFQCFVDIEQEFIQFTRNGKGLTVDNAGLWIHHSVARLDKGIPNPKARPVLPLPWELSFTLTLLQNKEVNEDLLKKMFDDGGICIGFGTYRGRYGKFVIKQWKTKNI